MATARKEPKMGKEYTVDDPEYWVLFAKSIGNPVPEIEDDSKFVDENGVVIAGETTEEADQPE